MSTPRYLSWEMYDNIIIHCDTTLQLHPICRINMQLDSTEYNNLNKAYFMFWIIKAVMIHTLPYDPALVEVTLDAKLGYTDIRDSLNYDAR